MSISAKEKDLLRLRKKRYELATKLPFIEDESGLGCMAHPLYDWQLAFILTKKKKAFTCAANQIGKSSGNWIRMLRFCYLQKYWDDFFNGQIPLPFWYFYPVAKLSTSEIKDKYIRQYLPHSDLKNHHKWGYKVEEEKRIVNAIHFNTGVSVYFKNYSQPPTNLQSATLSGVFSDEEMPENLFDELIFRGISRDNFYYHNVFTATQGQEYLRRVIEHRDHRELFPEAFKQQINMYQCLTYADGTPSKIWTKKKILSAIASCTSEAEVQRRVWGKFVLSENRKFHGFDHDSNTCEGQSVPSNWLIYGGLDWGSGGAKGHPSAILFIAVSPDFKQGRVFLSWRGDGIATTQGDVVTKYVKMSRDLSVTQAAYDFSAADIGTIAARSGISLTKANKNQDTSVEMINTLFKNKQLLIYVGEGYEQNDKLISEIASALDSGSKKNDDLVDALRYAVTLVPWQFEIQRYIKEDVKAISKSEKKISKRERFWKYGTEDDMFKVDSFDDAMQYYSDLNEMYEL